MTNATAKATIHTNYGDIVVELFGNHAPLTVENFIGLADGSRQWKHPRTGEIMNTPCTRTSYSTASSRTS